MIAKPTCVSRMVELIHAEYREMPGLCLTKAQFQRLWGLDVTTRDALLDALVAAQVLKRTPRDAYVLANERP
jgi:hypothetical protein